MRRWSFIAVYGLLASTSQDARADQRRPTALVLAPSTNSADVALQRRFYTELALCLDHYKVERVTAQYPLAKLSSGEQVEALRKLLEERLASVAVWVESGTQGLLAQVVITGDRGATIRRVEAEQSDRPMASLGLAICSLLESVAPTLPDTQEKRADEPTPHEQQADLPPSPADAEVAAQALSGTQNQHDFDVVVATGMWLAPEATSKYGATLTVGLDIALFERLLLRTELLGTLIFEQQRYAQFNPRILGSVKARYLIPFDRWHIAPHTGVGAVWSKQALGLQKSPSYFDFRASAGTTVSYPLFTPTRLGFVLDVGFMPEQRTFRGRYTQQILAKSARYDVIAALEISRWSF